METKPTRGDAGQAKAATYETADEFLDDYNAKANQNRIAELERENATLREASAAENESCAVLAESWSLKEWEDQYKTEIAEAIRARMKE